MNDFVSEILGFIIVLFVILVSMSIHELMHGFVAYKLGDDTAKNEGRLSLNPLKHLDLFYSIILPVVLYFLGGPIFGGAKPVPVDSRNLKGKEWGMAAVAVAGPLTNLILAFLAFLLRFLFLRSGGANEIVDMTLSYFVSINLGFAVFNILPIPPLDGSRVLYALAPDAIREVMLKLEAYGLWIICGLVIIFGSAFSGYITAAINGIYNVFLWIVGL